MIKSALPEHNRVSMRNYHNTLMDLQKCHLPLKYFEDSEIQPGNWASITLDNDSTFICQLFINEDNDLVIPNNAVCATEGITSTGSDILKEIEVFQKPQTFNKILIDVFVGESCLNQLELLEIPELFDNTLEFMCGFFKFSQKCTINLKNFRELEQFSVKRIEIVETDLGGNIVGTANGDTEIIVRNLRYEDKRAIKPWCLGGVENILEMLENNVRNTMEFANENNGIKPPSNVLLVGPSGCGKSSLIDNLAYLVSANLFPISSMTLPEFEGETKFTKIIDRLIRFSKISKKPTIILIEDVENLCPKSSPNRFQSEKLCHEFLANLDRLSEVRRISVFCTTRNVEMVSEKARRPGRLEQEVFIKVPTDSQRRSIVQALMEPIKLADKTPLIDYIVDRTAAFVGGDLMALLQTALRLNGITITSRDVDEALRTVQSVNLRSNPYFINISTEFSLKKLGGLTDLKSTLKSAIFKPLENPNAYKRFGIGPPKGILFYGPPGCAKTTIVKCLANEMNRNLISVSSAQLYSPYVGDSEQLLANIFHQARICAPSIVFIDEIDSIIGRRTAEKKGSDIQSRILSILLVEMDGIGLKVQANTGIDDVKDHILIIGATNRPDMIDDALMRPGRFDRLIHVPAPNAGERLDILRKITAEMPLDETVNLSLLNESMTNFSGADLSNFCNEVALAALSINVNATELNMADFEGTLALTRASLTEDQIHRYKEFELRHRTV